MYREFDSEQWITNDELFRTVRIGDDTAHFFKTNEVGLRLLERAQALYKSAILEFEQLSTAQIMSTPEKVLDIKQRIDLARAFVLWIDENIQDARRAEDTLRARDDADRTID